MAFPAGLTLVTVHGRFDTLPSGGARGTVRFVSPAALLGAADNSVVPFVDVMVSLDADGEFEVALPATNDPGWSPSGWAYTVTLSMGRTTRTGTIQLDYETTSVEFSDLFQPDGAATAGTTYATAAQLGAVSDAVEQLSADSEALQAVVDLATGSAPILGDYQVYKLISDGVVTGVNTLNRRTLPAGVSLDLFRLRFTNSESNGDAEADTANAITVRCSVGLTTTGPWYPATFRGSKSIVIDPGADVDSDPLAVHVDAGGTFYTKCYLSVTSGQTWVAQQPWGAAGTNYWCSQSNGEADLSTSTAAFTATSGNRPWGPVAIVDECAPKRRASVAIVGDSLAGGAGDAPSNYGFAIRALSGVLPYQRIAVSASRAQAIVSPTTGRRRLALVRGCNVAIDEYGINDITSGANLATLQARKLLLWMILNGMGMRVFSTTITPVTTSSDSWATTGNQTLNATNGVRTSYNDWTRASAPINATTKAAVAIGTPGALLAGQPGHPLTGYFEIADIVESARNSGRWQVDGTASKYTADGTHPTAFAHNLMAAAIDTAGLISAVS